MQETDFLKGNQRVLNDIKKFEIFEPFQDDELHHLMSMSKIRKYNPGRNHFRAGQRRYVALFSGLWESPADEGQQTGVQLQRRGDVFGEMGAIECAPRSASAVASAKRSAWPRTSTTSNS
jgi:CRP/FNR family cyclic AMP-dependent transcriptional regulator